MADQEFTTFNEIWKPIPGFPGYEVSDHGRVRSFYRKGHNHRPIFPPTIKKQYIRSYYFYVPLQQNKVQKTRDIHRLVLATFRGPCPIGMEACHNDGNPLNNHLSNLRWDTPLNNSRDKYKHGTINQGERNGASFLTDSHIKAIRYLFSIGFRIATLSYMYKCYASNICQIVHRQTWKHIV